jgi:Zn finger protein HypA/HybF involved in hydrogenase expression
MFRLRRYHRELAARQAASHLKAHGIPAVVGNDTLNQTLGFTGIGLFWSGFDLYIAHEGLAERAERLLDGFHEPASEADEPVDWDAAMRVDLSLLDAERLRIDCGECSAPLPLDELLETCPRCSARVDPIERVVELHGPEALADAYAEHEPTEGEGAVRAEDVDVPCPSCGYSFMGLPVTGRCPECGSLFDKRELLRRM